jgi:predicted Zn-dependent peptidase
MRGLASSDPAAPALALFAQAVGGGMSSRLFQQLREDRGLAYSIYAWTQGFAETGLFGVNLSTDKARAAEAMALARECVEQAAEDLSEAELKRARAQMEAGLLMSLETPQGRADSIARSIEIFGRIISLDEMLAELRAVDAAAARAAGQAMLSGPRASAVIGAKIALAA